MKKIALLTALCLLLTACSLPFTINWNTTTPPPQGDTPVVVPTDAPVEPTAVPPTAAPAFEGTEYNLGNIYMVVPPCLPVTPSGVIIPSVPYDEMNGPQEYYPEHRKITFAGYPLSGKFFEPMIRVYPVAEFTAMNSIISDRVNALQSLLVDKPADPDSFPFLPLFNAAQVFHAKVGYFPFQNGSGVRFLTEYAQYYAPMNNYDLFYTYQGLTADGKYWISAIFPVNAVYLQETWNSTQVPPDGVPAPAWDSANLESDMQAYYATMIDRLNNTPEDGFTPSIACLDQFLQSVNVGD
ncbi:MAG: hypothetical protein GYA36_22230 [Veillonellaceae bacterium]|nr:hypothetical protein [Veillonellaceae bacterium]